VAVVIIVVMIVVAAGVVIYLVEFAPVVDVTGINIFSPDNACGQNASPGYFGFNATPGTNYAIAFPIQNYNTTLPNCTIRGASTNTSGFGVTDVGTVTLPPEGNGTLVLTLVLPQGAWTGALNLIFR